jgi:hypothetical protein
MDNFFKCLVGKFGKEKTFANPVKAEPESENIDSDEHCEEALLDAFGAK